jgi:hypothetical protein
MKLCIKYVCQSHYTGFIIVVCTAQKSYREDDGTEMVPVEDFLRALWQGDIL